MRRSKEHLLALAIAAALGAGPFSLATAQQTGPREGTGRARAGQTDRPAAAPQPAPRDGAGLRMRLHQPPVEELEDIARDLEARGEREAAARLRALAESMRSAVAGPPQTLPLPPDAAQAPVPDRPPLPLAPLLEIQRLRQEQEELRRQLESTRAMEGRLDNERLQARRRAIEERQRAVVERRERHLSNLRENAPQLSERLDGLVARMDSAEPDDPQARPRREQFRAHMEELRALLANPPADDEAFIDQLNQHLPHLQELGVMRGGVMAGGGGMGMRMGAPDQRVERLQREIGVLRERLVQLERELNSIGTDEDATRPRETAPRGFRAPNAPPAPPAQPLPALP